MDELLADERLDCFALDVRFTVKWLKYVVMRDWIALL
jgi:hypothetical protein